MLRGPDTGPPPASAKAIANLDRDVAPPASGDTSCSVCLCGFEPGEKATRMPCGHLYHEACLTKWLTSHNTCPSCRYEIEADDTPRPNSLAALINGWREARQRADAAEGGGGDDGGGGAASSSSGAASSSTGSGSSSMNPLPMPMPAGFPFGPPPQPPPPAPMSEEALMGLSVAELKRTLARIAVDHRGVLEKSELQDLLRPHTRPASPAPMQVHMHVMTVPPGMWGSNAPPPGPTRPRPRPPRPRARRPRAL